MAAPLSVLLVEDSAIDAELVTDELGAAYDLTAERVASAEQLAATLERRTWDVILSDYNLPGFSAFEALELCQAQGCDAPFVIVSGTIGEEAVVELLHAGARGVVLKSNLRRLVPVVTQELANADGRRKQHEAEVALRESEERFRRLADERRSLLERLVRAQEEERQRIAADIHDDSAQVMSALVLRLGLLQRRVQDPALAAALEEAVDTARNSVSRLRHMMFALRPPALDRDGLAVACRLYLEEMHVDSGLEFQFDCNLEREPDANSRAIIYRIAQEALTNVRKHAAAAQVRIDIASHEHGVLTRIADDGRGFAARLSGNGVPGHLGLMSMRERAEMAGGWWKVESAPGAGTTVEFYVPVTEERVA